MASYRQLLYHFVFRTKNGNPVMDQARVQELYSYITGIVRNKKSHLYRINGAENHIHMITDLHPSESISDFMRDIKVSTSVWIKNINLFNGFDEWAEGYGVFTFSYRDLGSVIDYVQNQQGHHHQKTFEQEYRSLIIESGVEIKEEYFP